MKPIHLASVLFILLVGFLIWEIIFSTQRYGLPKFNLSPQPNVGSCKILEEKYCNDVKLIQGAFQYLAFKLPIGTKIFSPIEGQEKKTKLPAGGTAQGFYVIINNPSDRNIESWSFMGDLKLSNMDTNNTKSGETFATIGNSGIKNFGDYNLIVGISKFDETQNKKLSASSTIRKLFPELK